LHWRLDEAVLDDETLVEQLAATTADAIERQALPSSLDPPATHEAAVVFDDEPHLRASHLLALARGRTAWFHAALEGPVDGDPLAALAAPDQRALAHATLVRLAAGGVLAEVLAAQAGPAVAVLAAALGCTPLPAGDEPRETIGRHAAVRELTAIASRWPALAPAARSLALRVHAAVLLDAEVEAPESVALAAAVPDDHGTWREQAIEPTPVPSPDVVVPDDRSETFDHPRIDESPEPVEPFAFMATRCAGVFYLLDRVQELDLGESLWKVCLPEGAVLAAAMSALLGRAFTDDPAPTLFGGVDGPAICPGVTAEQNAEVATATCAALAAALPRRGLADIPSAVVTLASHPSGRLLAVAAEGSPFVFFAWPATTPELLKDGLRALLDTWPHRGALAATPALVSVDTSGRLRPRRDGPSVPLLLPEAASTPAAALLALVAGAPCTLFAARAGAPAPDAVEAFVARHLTRRGRIRLGPERMDILLSADEVDLDARRAGLDRDPGWLPWLGRTVRFVFEERGPAGGEP
jgi:hypothetical protein